MSNRFFGRKASDSSSPTVDGTTGAPPPQVPGGAGESPEPSDGGSNPPTSMRLLVTPKVYIAGPYSRGDVVRNVAKAIIASNYLMGKGYRVYVPHLSHFQHMMEPRNYWDWLEHGVGWLLDCDCVLLLPGPSMGATLECQIAAQFDIPVFTSAKDLEEKIPFKIGPRPKYEEFTHP